MHLAMPIQQENKLALWPYVVAALLFSKLASAATLVTVQKQWEYGGPGTQFSTAVDGGSINVGFAAGENFQVTVLGTDGRELHTFTFLGPDNSVIEVGRYDNTSPAAAVPGFASLDYVFGNTGCGSGAPGYFIVREFEYPSGADGLTHIAIDYFHRCGAFVDIRRPV